MEYDSTIDCLQRLKQTFIDGMTNNRIDEAVLTIIETVREFLVTTEDTIDYYKGKNAKSNGYFDSINEHSLNDDLEIFFEKIQLGQITSESVATFCFPKLKEKEMKLVESKDEYHMASYTALDMDVDDTKMKTSESKSKFVFVNCTRLTFVLTNRPINDSLKRSTEDLEQFEIEPKSPKIRSSLSDLIS